MKHEVSRQLVGRTTGTRARYRDRAGVIRMCAGILAHVAGIAQGGGTLTRDERRAYNQALAVLARIDRAGGMEAREK